MNTYVVVDAENVGWEFKNFGSGSPADKGKVWAYLYWLLSYLPGQTHTAKLTLSGAQCDHVDHRRNRCAKRGHDWGHNQSCGCCDGDPPRVPDAQLLFERDGLVLVGNPTDPGVELLKEALSSGFSVGWTAFDTNVGADHGDLACQSLLEDIRNQDSRSSRFLVSGDWMDRECSQGKYAGAGAALTALGSDTDLQLLTWAPTLRKANERGAKFLTRAQNLPGLLTQVVGLAIGDAAPIGSHPECLLWGAPDDFGHEAEKDGQQLWQWIKTLGWSEEFIATLPQTAQFVEYLESRYRHHHPHSSHEEQVQYVDQVLDIAGTPRGYGPNPRRPRQPKPPTGPSTIGF